MAKEFKEWDKKFSKAQIFECRKEWLGDMAGDNSNMITKWIYDTTSSWSADFIREAVYLNDTAGDWQLFRVSMKGLSTKEKLYMLGARWTEFTNNKDRISDTAWTYEWCRITNYIGALRRGGQLNAQFEAVK